MAISADSVAVAAAQVSLNTPGPAGVRMLIKNTGGANVADLGPTGVTLGTGFELATGATVEVTLQPNDELFAIAIAGGTTLKILRS